MATSCASVPALCPKTRAAQLLAPQYGLASGRLVLLALALITAPLAGAEPLAETVAASQVQGGLCVVLPAGDGAALAQVAKDGSFVVQGLALSEAEVASVRAAIPAATHGLATVRAWKPGEALPYADHLVNLLVVDADALGARCPSDADLLRAVVPESGALRLRRKGVWSTLRAPRPATFGSWTHYYGDATGNPVSTDNVPGPATALQWIADGPAAMAWQTFMLVDGENYVLSQFDINTKRNQLVARSAFNGFHRWTTRAPGRTGKMERDGPMVLFDGRVYTLVAPDQGPLVALDAVSGVELLRFAGDLPALTSNGKQPTHPGNLAVWDDIVLLARADQVICWDRRTGVRRWVFDGQGRNLAFPAVDPKNRRVGVLMAKDNTFYMHGDRETSFWPQEILSLDLADGREVWRVPYPFRDLAPSETLSSSTSGLGRVVSAFLWAEGAFFMNMSKGLGKIGFDLGAVDADTGATRWLKPDVSRWAGSAGDPGAGVGSLLVYPQAVVLTRSALLLYDPATGTSIGEWRIGNGRCDNGRGAAWGFNHFGHFFSWKAGTAIQGQRSEIARNNCGGGTSNANGMLYYQPQVCGCFAAVRGMMALSRQQPGDPTPDAQRLLPGPALTLKPARREGDGDWPVLLGDQRRSAAGSALPAKAPVERWRRTVATPRLPGAIAAKEQASAAYNGPLSAPVIAGGLLLVSEPEAHRLHALDATSGTPVWSVTVGGRVDTPPTVAGGRVYAGSRDGWVTCLDLATGQVAWRFLAARNARQIGAWGQPESAWPVHGSLVVANGVVVVTAGYHPDADGGMLAWGLDAATGSIRWQRTITSAREIIELDPTKTTTGSDSYFNANKVENGIPSFDGTAAVLGSLRLSIADGSGSAKLGGLPWTQRTSGAAEPPPDYAGLMVTGWGLAGPWLRSAVGNFHGPGDIQDRLGYTVSGGGRPRRAAWNAEVAAVIRMKTSDLLLFDPSHPIGSYYHRSRMQKPGEVARDVGLFLERIELSDALVRKPSQYGPSTLDTSAMVLAGNTLFLAWGPDATGTPRGGAPHHNRPESVLQVVDLTTKTLVSSAPVKPGVIDHGLAVAHGMLYMVHDDGSVSAWGP